MSAHMPTIPGPVQSCTGEPDRSLPRTAQPPRTDHDAGSVRQPRLHRRDSETTRISFPVASKGADVAPTACFQRAIAMKSCESAVCVSRIAAPRLSPKASRVDSLGKRRFRSGSRYIPIFFSGGFIFNSLMWLLDQSDSGPRLLWTHFGRTLGHCPKIRSRLDRAGRRALKRTDCLRFVNECRDLLTGRDQADDSRDEGSSREPWYFIVHFAWACICL